MRFPTPNGGKWKQALQAFDRLPPAQRAQCINSFGKFATMAPGERNQFLKNAARWDAMTSHERQLWRELVHTLPPMPPGFPSGLPPLPPGFQQGDAAPAAHAAERDRARHHGPLHE